MANVENMIVKGATSNYDVTAKTNLSGDSDVKAAVQESVGTDQVAALKRTKEDPQIDDQDVENAAGPETSNDDLAANDDVDDLVQKDQDDIEYREIGDDGWEDVLGSGRLRKKVIREGDKGQGRPNRGDVVQVSLKGFFQEELFEEVTNVEFVVSEAEVIQAVDLVVCLMNTGEVCEVISDPEFAYGDLGFGSVLPPKAAVRLELELLGHQPPIPAGEIEDVQEKLRIGRRKKERGNFWHQRQNYTFAVQCYRRAGEYFDDEKLELEVPIDRYQLPEELQTLLEERLKAFNNLAMAQIKIEAWEAALSSLRQVTKIEPNNEKALYRKSKVLTEKGLLDEALGALRRVTRLYPNNISAKKDLERLMARRQKSLLNEQNMSRKMLGLDKNIDYIKRAEEEDAENKRSFLSKVIRRNMTFLTSAALVGFASIALGGGYFAYTRV